MMRRKSDRKSKTSPEKKTPERPSRLTLRRRRQKSISSSPEREKKTSENEIDSTPVVESNIASKETSNSNSEEEKQEEQPVWQVKSAETPPGGEIQKLKICLQRPSSTPERAEKSPRRHRKHRGGATDEDSSEGKKSKSSRKRRHQDNDEEIVESSSEDKGTKIHHLVKDEQNSSDSQQVSSTDIDENSKLCDKEDTTGTPPPGELNEEIVGTTSILHKTMNEDDSTNHHNGPESTTVIEETVEEVPTREVPVAEVSVEKTLTEKVPTVKTPTQETTVEETTVEETTVEETTVEETTAEETTAEDTPVKDTSVEETSAKETSAKETPAEGMPAEETPAEGTPAEETPTEEMPAEETPAKDMPTEETPAKDMPAEETPADEVPIKEVQSGEIPAEEIGQVNDSSKIEQIVGDQAEIIQRVNTEVIEMVVEEKPKEIVKESQNEEISNSDSSVQKTKIEQITEKKQASEESVVNEIESEAEKSRIPEPKVQNIEKTKSNTPEPQIQESEKLKVEENIKNVNLKEKSENCVKESTEKVQKETIEKMDVNEEHQKEYEKLPEADEKSPEVNASTEKLNNNENQIKENENKINVSRETNDSSGDDTKSPVRSSVVSVVNQVQLYESEPMEEQSTYVADPSRKKLKLKEAVNEYIQAKTRLTSENVREICPDLRLLSLDEVHLEDDTRSHNDDEISPRKAKKKPFEDKKITIQTVKEFTATPTVITPPIITTNPMLANRKISIVGDDSNNLHRPPSPAKNEPSPILYIKNLVRPFTLNQLKELLSRTGTIKENGFWINKIKSECYVHYETLEQSVETRNALHGVHWPVANGRRLDVDFGTEDAMEKARIPTEIKHEIKPEVPVTPEAKPKEEAVDWREVRERERLRREQRGVREWDVGKQGPERSPTPPVSKRRQHSPPSRNASPDRKSRKKEDVPSKLLDDLFKKTKATPCIYWLPLSAEMIVIKEEQRRKHMAEHERRLAEIRRVERLRRVPGGRSRDTDRRRY